MIGESQRDDVAIERRRTAVIALAATGVILLVLAAGGAISLGAALLSGGSLAALMVVYLAAAGQGDEPRRAAALARGAPKAGFSIDESARVVLDALPDPVIIVRAGGRIELLNAAARRELRAQGAEGALASVVREPRVLDAVEAALDRRVGATVEYREAAPRERHFRALVAPFRPPGSGEAARALVVFRDESAIKRSEAARADFLANASHELRTPLASLTGFIETLRGHARDDEEARDRFLAIMSQQAERMRRLIDDLLSLSRLEQTEHVAPQGTVDLVTLAGEVMDALAPLAEERGLDLRLRAQVESAPITGDREELVQVVQNLLDNALKYAEVGEVVVEVGVARGAAAAAHAPQLLAPHAARMTLLDAADSPDADFVWLRVSDTGRGIERRHLPRLSERFFRGDPEESAGVQGTGLGLAIVRQVMARHRGGLSVESAPGAGARFTIYARLAAQARAPAAAPRPTISSAAPEPRAG